jgi:CRP/FNR family transcriptional regulator
MEAVLPDVVDSAPRPTPLAGGASAFIQFREHAPSEAPMPRAPCFDCHVRRLCLPAAVGDQALHDLDGAMLGRRRVRRGQALYRQGDRVQHLYAVRRGSFKLSAAVGDGRDQVLRIALPGDMLGLTGMAAGACTATAIALEDSDVCSVPEATLRRLAAGHPEWQASLMGIMAAEIARQQRHMLVLGSYDTEARVVFFLLEFSGRLQERGYSGAEFHLRLTRAEIGSYLGLTLETISRTFSAFQQRGWMRVRKRHITIVDPARLKLVALTQHIRRAGHAKR